MSLVKRTYVDQVTVITAENLNAIQDEIIANGTAIEGKIGSAEKGEANGVAGLDSTGKVPSTQIPASVNDVLEYNDLASFPSSGVSGKIYVAKDTGKIYRWTGAEYAELSPSLVLGETSGTAYRGDRGKTAYDDSQTNKANIGTMANLTTTEKGSLVGAVNELNAGKVDKVTGKGLSTEDYTSAEKTKLGALPTSTELADDLAGKVDKVTGKGLSTEDYTSAEKTKLGALPTAADLGDSLAGKVDKVTGKGLSTEDYTSAEKTKLSGIEAQANKTEIDDTLTEEGQAADAKAVGDELDGVKDTVNSYVRPNLLDNWYFVGGGSQLGSKHFPINRRKSTSYANATSNTYCIDRWYYNRGSVAVASDGITLSWNGSSLTNAYIQQRTDQRVAGMKLTATVLFADGTLISGTAVQTTTGDGSTEYYNQNGHVIRVSTYAQNNAVAFVYLTTLTSGKKIAAVKLEIGDTQTLAHYDGTKWVLNEVPDYDVQMMQCCSPAPDTGDNFANNSLDSHSVITSDFSAKTDIMNLEPGYYRVVLSATPTYLPATHGMLLITRSQDYAAAYFLPINSSVPALYFLTWNATGKTWYQDGKWRPIQHSITHHYVSSGNYDLYSYQMGRFVLVTGNIYGSGTAEYLPNLTLPTGMTDMNSIFRGRCVSGTGAGTVRDIRTGANGQNIYREAAMASGSMWNISYTYIAATEPW